MATGRLGHADLTAATNTSLYTVPANTFGIVTLSVCNRGNSAVSIRVAVASAGSLLAGEGVRDGGALQVAGVEPLVRGQARALRFGDGLVVVPDLHAGAAGGHGGTHQGGGSQCHCALHPRGGGNAQGGAAEEEEGGEPACH